jgi:hypothetical protein
LHSIYIFFDMMAGKPSEKVVFMMMGEAKRVVLWWCVLSLVTLGL